MGVSRRMLMLVREKVTAGDTSPRRSRIWDGKSRLSNKMRVRGWKGNERSRTQSPVSGIPHDCKHRKDESKTLCEVFLETLGKPEPRGLAGDKENIFKLKPSKSGGAKIQAGKDPRGQNKK